jgi:hypothetical protein
MEANMKDFGRMINVMAKVFTFLQTETNMKDNGKITNVMVKVF